MNRRMREGQWWEQYVAEWLVRDGWTVGPWGQALLPDDSRDIVKTTGSLWRWIPDLIAKREVVVLVEAKFSSADKTGNHAVESSSSRSATWSQGGGIRAVYAFPHQLDGCYVPKFCAVASFIRHQQERLWMGSGSGTPFHVAACDAICCGSIPAAFDCDGAAS